MSHRELILAPSILAADFAKLGADVQAVERGGARYLHIDIMDGHFVPPISFGPGVFGCLRPISNLVFDVHMMTEEPDKYLEDLKKAGADIVTVHYEACTHLHRTIGRIHELGMKAGVVLNPATDPSVLSYILEDIEMVLCMSVNPGYGGQKFIPSTLRKLEEVRAMADKVNPDLDIEVDGGVNAGNIAELAARGCNVFVAGSACFGADPEGNARKLVAAMAAVRGEKA